MVPVLLGQADADADRLLPARAGVLRRRAAAAAGRRGADAAHAGTRGDGGGRRVAMCVVLGVPPVFWIVTRLPVFSSGHNTRLAVLYLLCLALLAGWGLDDLVRRRRVAARAGRRGRAAGVPDPLHGRCAAARRGTCVGDALAVAFGLRPRAGAGRSDRRRRGARRGDAAVDGRRGRRALAVLARAAPALAGGAARSCWSPPISPGRAWATTRRSTARWRSSRRPARSASCSAPRPERFVSIGEHPENAIPMDYEIPEARGYDLPVEERFDRLWRSKLSPEFPSQVGPLPAFIPLVLPKVDEDRLRCSRSSGSAAILQPPTDPPLRVPRACGWSTPGPDARIYANDAALPRAFVVGAQRRRGATPTRRSRRTAFDARPRRGRRVRRVRRDAGARGAGADPAHRERPPGGRDAHDAPRDPRRLRRLGAGLARRHGRAGRQGRARRLPLPRRSRARGHATSSSSPTGR